MNNLFNKNIPKKKAKHKTKMIKTIKNEAL